MMKLKNLLVPQDDVFFRLMEKQAETAHSASEALFELLKEYRNIRVKSSKIKAYEHEGDQLMRDLYTALNKTFIVPIDHSDISTLANALDDVLDLIDQASTLLVVYEIKAPSPAMVQMAGLLVEQTKELKHVVAAINHSRTYGKVPAHCTRIKHLENKADDIYTEALAALFKKKEPIEVMKQKEILDCLEEATDKADKASQHISDIVMKHS